MSWADNLSKNDENLPISNPKLDVHNIYAQTEFGENALTFTQVIIQKRKYGRADRRMTDGWIAGEVHGWTNTQMTNVIP